MTQSQTVRRWAVFGLPALALLGLGLLAARSQGPGEPGAAACDRCDARHAAFARLRATEEEAAE
jgi:hypothetical protein